MELTVERGNVVLHNGAIAAGALWCEHVEVVVAAIGLSVALMEAIVAELLATLSAEKVLGMPGLVEGCDAFLWKIQSTINICVIKNCQQVLHPRWVHCSKRIGD